MDDDSRFNPAAHHWESTTTIMFPSQPMAPWQEQLLLKELDDGEVGASIPETRCVDDATRLFYKSFLENDRDFLFQLPEIEIGEHVDIQSLLFPSQNDFLIRRNGAKVTASDLRGKYVLICCFFVPDIWDSNAWECSIACSELYCKLNNTKKQFEMVMVAKMRHGWADATSPFDHFFSGFPSSCLAVPFDATSRRDTIYMFLGCIDIGCTALLVSPGGDVLLHSEVNPFGELQLIPCYGQDSSPFPFTTESRSRLMHQFFTTPSSLEDFLGSSGFVFRKIGGSEEEEKVFVSELKSKLVGLYVYTTGDLLRLLRDIDRGCRRTQREFEIVIVYAPDFHSQDPRLFLESLSSALAKRNISWWVAPFNYFASLRLKLLFDGDEKVVILGPDGKYVDTRGTEIMKIYGIDAYPFTLERVVEKTVEELRQVTTKSFCESLDISCKSLIGRNVLFYFDSPHNIDNGVLKPLLETFSKLRPKDHNSRLIPISLAVDHGYFPDSESSKDIQSVRPSDFLKFRGGLLSGKADYSEIKNMLPWATCPNAIEHFYLRFFKYKFATVVAFGKDGRIHSIRAHHHFLSSPGAKGFPLEDKLFEEVSCFVGTSIKMCERDELDIF